MSAFWDSSAVLHLCVPGRAKGRAKSILQSAPPVIWWGTPVEVQSALARLKRQGALSEGAYQASRERLAAMMASWKQVQPAGLVRDLAMDALERLPLKAADAFQLAAGLAWSKQKPRGRLFVSNDVHLSSCARELGFEVTGT